MLILAESLRSVLIVFIALLGALLGTLLLLIVVQHLVRDARWRRHAQRRRHCEPYVDAILSAAAGPAQVRSLVERCGGPRRRAAGELLLAPLRSMSGDVADRSREALVHLGLRDDWLQDLADRRWWIRADAAESLGLIAEPAAVAPLLGLLDDESAEVQAAALDALGRLRDVSTLPHLVSLLGRSDHPRARVVGALRPFGPLAAEVVGEWTRSHGGDRLVAAAVLGQIGSATGLELLVGWCGDRDDALREACYRAMAEIGVDDRAYYFALRALDDAHPGVRAMAARILGRSGRPDAARYLAPRLRDEWTVAAHAAVALRSLGESGLAPLVDAAKTGGPGADLAQQMLWEMQQQG